MGIEPTWSAWKAEVLPLNYICVSFDMFYYIISIWNINVFLLKMIKKYDKILFRKRVCLICHYQKLKNT